MVKHKYNNGVEQKHCAKCHAWQPLLCFNKEQKRKDGLYPYCKTCCKNQYESRPEKYLLREKEYREANKKKKASYDKKYNQINSSKAKEYRIANNKKITSYNKAYYQANLKKERERAIKYYWANQEKVIAYRKATRKRRAMWQKNYLKANPHRRLSQVFSWGIRHSLKNKGKGGLHWEELVPYTYKDLEGRLKKTLPSEYVWEDYIAGETDLHIDHIIPMSVFNFLNYTDIDFQRCWALSNLRLLPKKINMEKKDKLDKCFQPAFAGI